MSTNLLQTPRPLGGFKNLYMDPPWAFETFAGDNVTPHRTEVDHYETMGAAALRRLPVPAMAARDCALFMWVVDSNLPEALQLGAAYGFEFKTIAFIWDKGDKIGMGYWTRKQAEICLLFTRGKPRVLDHGVRQIIRAPRREHSRKPDETYEGIERLCAGPRLELFARTSRPGWTSWGNQVDKFDDEVVMKPRRLA